MLQWLCAQKSPADAAEERKGLWIGPHQIGESPSERSAEMSSVAHKIPALRPAPDFCECRPDALTHGASDTLDK